MFLSPPSLNIPILPLNKNLRNFSSSNSTKFQETYSKIRIQGKKIGKCIPKFLFKGKIEILGGGREKFQHLSWALLVGLLSSIDNCTHCCHNLDPNPKNLEQSKMI
jgi:hypothetical protein